MEMKYFVIFLLMIMITTPLNGISYQKSEIKNNILSGYRKDMLPDCNDSQVNVSIGIALRSLNDVDHIKGQLKINIWLRYKWNDERLKNEVGKMKFYTDPSMYGSIWIPDIYLYNMGSIQELEYTLADVSKDGEVRLSRPGIITTTCKFDLKDFPYDEQFCEIKMGSWVYSANDIYLKKYEPFFDISNYQENEEWDLVSYNSTINNKKYDCCVEEYQDITFGIKIRRRSEYYNMNIILPGFLTASLMIISLMIPHSTGERISFATTIMLSVIVFLLILSDNLPKTANSPLISFMFIGLLMLSLVVLFIVINTASFYENTNICCKVDDEGRCQCKRFCCAKIRDNEEEIGGRNDEISNYQRGVYVVNKNRIKRIKVIENVYMVSFMVLFVAFMVGIMSKVPKYE